MQNIAKSECEPLRSLYRQREKKFPAAHFVQSCVSRVYAKEILNNHEKSAKHNLSKLQTRISD